MVASNRIHCTVVAVPVADRVSARRVAQELLPWADPYVAQLIRNLQDEVRYERRMRSAVRHYRPAVDSPVPFSTSSRISAAK